MFSTLFNCSERKIRIARSDFQANIFWLLWILTLTETHSSADHAWSKKMNLDFFLDLKHMFLFLFGCLLTLVLLSKFLGSAIPRHAFSVWVRRLYAGEWHCFQPTYWEYPFILFIILLESLSVCVIYVIRVLRVKINFWSCSSVVGCLPTIDKALCSVPTISHTQK